VAGTVPALLSDRAVGIAHRLHAGLPAPGFRTGQVAGNEDPGSAVVAGEWKGGVTVRPQRRGSGPARVSYPLGYPKDAKLITVPETARYIFLVIVLTMHELSTRGRITRAQIAAALPGTRHLGRYVDRLCEAELLRYDATLEEYAIVDTEKWITPIRDGQSDRPTIRPDRGSIVALSRPDRGPIAASRQSKNGHNVAQPWPKEDDVSAGQNDMEDVPRAQGWARSPAQPRAGSFEVPSSSRTDGTPKAGRDAPRSGGGAARPARKTDPIESVEIPPEGVTMRAPDAQAAIRATLNNTKATSPLSTGTDTTFSKYPPDRPTEPIPSVLFRDEESE